MIGNKVVKAFLIRLGAVHCTVIDILMSHHCFLDRRDQVRGSIQNSGFTLDLMQLQDVFPIEMYTAILALERSMK